MVDTIHLKYTSWQYMGSACGKEMLNLRCSMRLLGIWSWVVGEGTEAREA
jgi:hypothetical protein